MNKHLLLILLGFGSLEAFSRDSEFKFSLNCKIKDQVIFQIKDGVSSRFNSYRNKSAIGDNFSVDFTMLHGEKSYLLKIGSDELMISEVFDNIFATNIRSLIAYKDINKRGVGWISNGNVTLNGSIGVFHLNRYFKNDWQLLFTSAANTNQTRMLTANCMNMPSKFDEVMSIIESISGELTN